MNRSLNLILIKLLFVGLMACSPSLQQPKPMQLSPGVSGTFAAIGMDLEQMSDHIIDGKVHLKNVKVFEGGAIGVAHEIESHDVIFTQDSPGLVIGTVSDGPQPLDSNAARSFIPASIAKLVTSGAALKNLGADFRFSTRVLWTAANSDTIENLIIVANGDPQVSRHSPESSKDPKRLRLKEIALRLKARGVHKLTGHLILISEDERHDLAIEAPGLDVEDRTECYNSISQSFNLDWNCSSIIATSAQSVRWIDQGLLIPLKNNLQAGSRTDLKVNANFDFLGRIESYSVLGVFNSRHPHEEEIALPVPQTKSWYAQNLLKALQAEGFQVDGVSLLFPEGSEAKSWLTNSNPEYEFVLSSDSLPEILKFMNKASDNFLADTLFKKLAGLPNSQESDLRSLGSQVIQAHVASQMDLHRTPEYVSEVHLEDGAGLSKHNFVTPRAYLALLGEFAKTTDFPALWDSLPIAGVDGTLKNRFEGTRAAGVVRAKTGTLKGSYQLAGYIPKLGPEGKIQIYIPFVILSETTSENRFKVYAFQTQVVSRLMDQINPRK